MKTSRRMILEVGDRVRCLEGGGSNGRLRRGRVYTVTQRDNTGYVRVDNRSEDWLSGRFEPCDPTPRIYPSGPQVFIFRSRSTGRYATDCIAESKDALIELAAQKYGGGRERWTNHPDAEAVCVELREVKG